jgi:hypothetical protein
MQHSLELGRHIGKCRSTAKPGDGLRGPSSWGTRPPNDPNRARYATSLRASVRANANVYACVCMHMRAHNCAYLRVCYDRAQACKSAHVCVRSRAYMCVPACIVGRVSVHMRARMRIYARVRRAVMQLKTRTRTYSGILCLGSNHKNNKQWTTTPYI